jgi:hypothetical protein
MKFFRDCYSDQISLASNENVTSLPLVRFAEETLSKTNTKGCYAARQI